MSIETAWKCLKTTFFELHPEAPNLLNPGATRTEIARLERFFPELPESVYELWGINDGEGGGPLYGALMLGFELMPIDQMLSIQEGWNQIADDFDEDGMNDIEGSVFPEGAGKADYFGKNYLVFGNNGASDYLVMDMSPGPTGTPGQITHVGRYVVNRYVVADGLESFFDLLTALHLDLRLHLWEPADLACHGSRGTWDGNETPMLLGLFSLLPVLYAEGRLYQAK